MQRSDNSNRLSVGDPSGQSNRHSGESDPHGVQQGVVVGRSFEAPVVVDRNELAYYVARLENTLGLRTGQNSVLCLELVDLQVEGLKEMLSHASPPAHPQRQDSATLTADQAAEMVDHAAQESLSSGYVAGVLASADAVEEQAKKLEGHGGAPAITRDVLFAIAAQLRVSVAAGVTL